MATSLNALKRRIANNTTLSAVEKEELPWYLAEYYQDANGRTIPATNHPEALNKASTYLNTYLAHRDPTRVTSANIDLNASNKAMNVAEKRTPANLTNLHATVQPHVSMMFAPPTGSRQAIIENRRKTLANAGNKSNDIRELIRNFNKMPEFQRQKALKAVRSSLGPEQYGVFLEGLKENTNFYKMANQVDRNHTGSVRKNVVYRGPGKAREIVQQIGNAWKTNRARGQRYARKRMGPFQTITAMQLQHTPLDGDGLFYSFANHLFRIRTGRYMLGKDKPTIDNTMTTIRNNVAAYIAKEKSFKNKPLYHHIAGKTVNLAKYAEYIQEPGTFTGHTVLDALSKIYNVPIYLYTRVPGVTFSNTRVGEYKRQPINFGSNFKRAPLFLVSSVDHGNRFDHTAKVHYNLLYSAEDVTPKENGPQSPQNNGSSVPMTSTMAPMSQAFNAPGNGNRRGWWSRWFGGGGGGGGNNGGGSGGMDGSSGIILISLTLSCVSSILKMALNK